ncbi:hypothetical protein AX27061_5697 [Achromobacter xylosoxidans NBRC 15126 = ATCC 27061]|nr:hypothetical protein AX27061_5697 [Achromobacter xylosoxidans NBRC 15126 = ATCC 27061]
MEPIGNGLPPCGHGGNTAPSIGIIRTGTKGLSQHVGPFWRDEYPCAKAKYRACPAGRRIAAMLRRRSGAAHAGSTGLHLESVCGDSAIQVLYTFSRQPAVRPPAPVHSRRKRACN